MRRTRAKPEPAHGAERVRLDVALVRRYPQLSRRKAREVIEKGQVLLDGAVVIEPGLSVAPHAAPLWDVNRPARPRARLSLPLLHQDETCVVVDKPAGLLTIPSAPSARDEDTALARVRDYAAHAAKARRRPFVGIVHRLDRDTSGAVAFALSPPARALFRRLFHEHRIERVYAALVAGVPTQGAGRVELPIRDAYLSGRRGVARPGEPSLPALTRWRLVERLDGAALLEVSLETGRQHQIRIHLAAIGHPVLGDRIYGGDAHLPARLQAPRQMLHARTLAFRNPVTGREVRVESPLPADFGRLLDRLRARRAR